MNEVNLGDLIAAEARWRVLNRPFAQRGYRGPAAAPDWIVELANPRLLLSAVHGVRHYRPSRGWKEQDAATGGLALALAELKGWSVAAVLRGGRREGDANWDADHPLKRELAMRGLPSKGGILLDLHGMVTRSDGVELSLGVGADTAQSSALGEVLVAAAKQHRMRVCVSDPLGPYRGGGPGTMVSWAQGRGIGAVQLEISSSARWLSVPRENRLRLLAMLSEAMDAAAALL